MEGTATTVARNLVNVFRGPALLAVVATLLGAGALSAQTTQGSISGRTYDRRTGQPVREATVRCVHLGTGAAAAAHSNGQGYYAVAFLSPGPYRLRVEAAAGREYLLPDNVGVLPFFGPDVDLSRSVELLSFSPESGSRQATLSYVIDPQQVEGLPLSGRDAYTMLVLQPGVTADDATACGLGLSIHGQRPSSSNFLLDGVENNNYLLSVPSSVLRPKATRKYRIGRAGGFVANAVTRSGGNGLLYAVIVIRSFS